MKKSYETQLVLKLIKAYVLKRKDLEQRSSAWVNSAAPRRHGFLK